MSFSYQDPLRGLCPAPFFDEGAFAAPGGYKPGRYCAPVDQIKPGLRCCLPCPASDWTYPSSFYSLTRLAGPINLVGLGLCAFMLLSFAVLPVEKTKRHYLNLFTIGCTVLMELGFIIPWAVKPEQCHDEITPNDMHTSMTCAWSGALVVFGGISITSWLLVRALSMHLLICWDLQPGKLFFWAANVFAWGLSIIVTAMELYYTGVSYRFGDYCHVNHVNSLQTLWVWVLAVSALALLLQVATVTYCLIVYLRSNTSGNTVKPGYRGYGQDVEPSVVSSTRSQAIRAVYQRVRKVVVIQWRGLAIALVVIANTIYFSVSFLLFDDQTQRSLANVDKVLPWTLCVVIKGKSACLEEAKKIVPSETRLIATLMVLAVIGVEVFILICRWEMLTGWLELFGKRKRGPEWVSVDAQRPPSRPSTYELLKVTTPTVHEKKHEGSDMIGSPSATTIDSPYSRASGNFAFQSPTRAYRSPTMDSTAHTMDSFSFPFQQSGQSMPMGEARMAHPRSQPIEGFLSNQYPSRLAPAARHYSGRADSRSWQ